MDNGQGMLTILYCQSLTTVFLESRSDKLAGLRIGAIHDLYGIVLTYSKMGFLSSLIEKIWEKKIAFILQAETKKDVAEILKPSVPYYDYNSFRPKSNFHVDEEEIILWSMASLQAPLKDFAFNRYLELFYKVLPEQTELLKGILSGGAI